MPRPSLPLSVRALQIAGAVLFVISLGWGGKAYVDRFDQVASVATSPWLPLLVNVALFSAFALHHSALARTPVKRAIHSRVGPEAERSLYVIVASLLYLGCCVLWRPLPRTWYVASGFWWWAGVSIQGLGVVITLVAARRLNLRELMGLQAPRRLVGGEQPLPPLETRGLYGLVRHPIYLGWLLFVFGAPVMTSTRLSFAVVSVLYLVIAIPFEEHSLVDTFGQPYRDYQRAVRWRMLPGVY